MSIEGKRAEREGTTVTDFVLHGAGNAAAHATQERAILILSAGETEAFVDAILNPPDPGPVLRTAASHYRKTPKNK